MLEEEEKNLERELQRCRAKWPVVLKGLEKRCLALESHKEKDTLIKTPDGEV